MFPLKKGKFIVNKCKSVALKYTKSKSYKEKSNGISDQSTSPDKEEMKILSKRFSKFFRVRRSSLVVPEKETQVE